MPTISTFLGIVIRMYYDDHAPPHFHAHYGDHAAIYRIDSLDVTEGSLPRRVHALVLEWASVNREALREDWELAAAHAPLRPIAPLE